MQKNGTEIKIEDVLPSARTVSRNVDKILLKLKDEFLPGLVNRMITRGFAFTMDFSQEKVTLTI